MNDSVRRTNLAIFLCCMFAVIAKAETSMPIVAFWGVPDTMTYERCFKDFSECGFTVSIYPYWSVETLVRACNMADRYGVKIIGRCPELFDNPSTVVPILKGTKGFGGYNIQDEPSAPQLAGCQQTIEKLKRYDDTHLFYVNLIPYYRQDWFANSARTSSLADYLREASRLSCQQMSFDFYPVTTEGIRSTWYMNIEHVRQASRAAGKPFWGFVLSVPHSVYPQPTMGSLRLQVYVNLAYGAQAIQYFTYWTPTPKNYNYHDAPIGLNGKKTKTYWLVQQMNRELKAVAPLFYGARVRSVHHLGTIPEGTTRLTTMPANLRALKVVGRQGAVVAQLEKDGHRYLAIVNKSHEQPLTVRIRPANATPRHLTKQLQEEKMKTSYSVEAGDLLLFRLT